MIWYDMIWYDMTWYDIMIIYIYVIYIYIHIIYKKCTVLSVPLCRGWVSVQMFMYIGMRRQKLDKMARDLAKKGKGSICLTARENHGPKNWNKWVTQSRTTTKQLPNNYQKNPALLLFPISSRCQFRFASVYQFRREIHWTCQDLSGHTLCHWFEGFWRSKLCGYALYAFATWVTGQSVAGLGLQRSYSKAICCPVAPTCGPWKGNGGKPMRKESLETSLTISKTFVLQSHVSRRCAALLWSAQRARMKERVALAVQWSEQNDFKTLTDRVISYRFHLLQTEAPWCQADGYAVCVLQAARRLNVANWISSDHSTS